jgi:hypothetical protein
VVGRNEPLDESTRELVRRIEEADWAFEEPRKTQVDGLTVYFWESVIGPYYRNVSKLSPIEAMIDEVKKEYPQLDNHYSLFVWVENQFSRVDGKFHEHNMLTWSTINVATEDPENCDVPRTEEMRARIRRSLGLPYDG